MGIRAHNAQQGGLFASSVGAPEQQRSPSRGVAEENVSSLLCGVGPPKGSGAIRGVGEKLTAKSLSRIGLIGAPIAMGPGRSGFRSQLTLFYDSIAGHDLLGLGWSPSPTSGTRKANKGLFKHRDAEGADVSILSRAEESVAGPSITVAGAVSCTRYDA